MRWRPTATPSSYDELQQDKTHKYVIYLNFLKGLHQDSFKLIHYDSLRMQGGKVVEFSLAEHQSILNFTLQHPTCLYERWKDRSISYEDNSNICSMLALTEQVYSVIPMAFVAEFRHEMRRLGKELDNREALMKNTASAT
ncbi:MAG: hypothetical protein R3Y11_08150 [Pseudomonadota bacterium]